MGWLSGWIYMRAVTITEQSGSTLTDYQVRIDLDSTNFDFSKANADGSDIRFTADDGVTELSYYIEKWDSASQVATIWVKVPSIPANGSVTIYMYYGNPSAVSESDPEAVFEFFDDFEGSSLDTSKWNKTGGTESVADSILSFYSGSTGTWYFIYSIQEFIYPVVMRTRFKLDRVNPGVGGHGKNVGFDNQALVGSSNDMAKFAWNSKEGKYQTQTRDGSTTNTRTSTYDFDNWGIGEIKWKDTTRVDFYYNDNLVNSHTENNPGDQIPISIDAAGSGYVYVDWVAVRKYAEQEPSISVGSETSPTISGIVKLSNGTPVQGATVISIREDTFKVVDVTTTGSDGSYTLAAAGGVNNTVIVIPSSADQNGDIKCHIQPV